MINDLKTEKIGYSDFVVADITQPEGNREFALSFSARETRDGFDLQSHWSLENYPVNESYYNFQIWASNMEDLKALALKTMQLLHEYLPINTMTTTGAPSLFVSHGAYNNGKLNLRLINKKGSQHFWIEGEKSPTETMTREPVYQAEGIEGHYSEYITLDVGAVYDMGFRIKHDNDVIFDDLFIADGQWYLDANESNLQYNISPDLVEESDELYPVERSIEITGTYENTLSIYRSLKPNFESVDLTKFNTIHFEMSGSQSVQIVLIKSSILDWEAQYKTSISTRSELNEISIPLSRFSNGTDEEIQADDIQAVIFKIENKDKPESINLEISSLDFRIEEDESVANAFENSEMIISPNPTQENFTVRWISSQEGIYNGMITDINSKTILEFDGLASQGQNQVNFERENIATGIYFLSIIEQSGKIISEKLVIIE